MNKIRKTVGLLMVLVLSTLAVPALAANPSKIFSLNVTPSVGSGSLAYAAVTNATITTGNSGNSIINSFWLQPPPGLTVSAPSGGYYATYTSNSNDTHVNATIAKDPTTGYLMVNGVSGLVPQNQNGSHTMYIWFNVAPTATCSSGSPDWQAQAFTGNSWSSGSPFNFVQDWTDSSGAHQSSQTSMAYASTATCTNPVSLTKIWVNALSGDTAALTISGAQVSAVAGSSTAPGTVTPATATAAVGSTVHLTEYWVPAIEVSTRPGWRVRPRVVRWR